MYYFIVNPMSSRGRGEKIWRKLEDQLRRAGVEYEAMLTEKPGDAGRIAEALTKYCREPRTIVAVGGDGTVNEILNGLAFEGQITLGYIPTGVCNDLARSLRLPISPRRCLKKVLNPKTYKNLDYGVLTYEKGEPEHRRFMVCSGIGLDGAICHNFLDIRSKSVHRRIGIGRLGYMMLGLKQLAMTGPVKGYLILDGTKKVEFNHIYSISTHIHPYEGGGFKIAPKANGEDGRLEICVIQNSRKLDLLPMMAGVLLGSVGRHRGMRFFSCSEVQIHVDAPRAVHVDGESCFSQTDIQLCCIARKIRMIL